MHNREAREGWFEINGNPWRVHYFRAGKKLPLCNVSIEDFNRVSAATPTEAQKCLRCSIKLFERAGKNKAA